MKLVCRNGHERKTRGFEPERDELTCGVCGGAMGTPSQMRRTELRRVLEKRERAARASGKAVRGRR